MSELKRICVYCGSSKGTDPVFEKTAVHLGELLAARGIGLVYGGGHVGLMGVIADTVLRNGGEVTGIIPHALEKRELAHHSLTELIVCGSMHERKQHFHQLSDAFIALPGGLGTFEELLETLTWMQLGIHANAVGVLNVEGYFDALLAMLGRAVSDGFLRKENRDLLIVERTPEMLLDALARYKAPDVEGWISPEKE
ncbi:MAG: TIGR00730 family Rossman fold protein [Chrysiogenetes bacterium]|nr:TIGR00730 family Rossman fold protein [Chrysiogenetes bacterium]